MPIGTTSPSTNPVGNLLLAVARSTAAGPSVSETAVGLRSGHTGGAFPETLCRTSLRFLDAEVKGLIHSKQANVCQPGNVGAVCFVGRAGKLISMSKRPPAVLQRSAGKRTMYGA